MRMIRKIIILTSVISLFILKGVNVYADSHITSDYLTQEELNNSFSDNPQGMILVNEEYKDLDETTYIEIKIYEKENSGLTRAGYKTKIGTYTYRVKDKKQEQL